MNEELKPCPFCGWEPPYDDPDQMLDVLYPSAIVWFQQDKRRHYVSIGQIRRGDSAFKYEDRDGECWRMNCTENMGGCGAQIEADSREETIAKWNRRV